MNIYLRILVFTLSHQIIFMPLALAKHNKGKLTTVADTLDYAEYLNFEFFNSAGHRLSAKEYLIESKNEVFVRTPKFEDVPEQFMLHLKWIKQKDLRQSPLEFSVLSPDGKRLLVSHKFYFDKKISPEYLNIQFKSIVQELKLKKELSDTGKAEVSIFTKAIQLFIPSSYACSKVIGGILMAGGIALIATSSQYGFLMMDAITTGVIVFFAGAITIAGTIDDLPTFPNHRDQERRNNFMEHDLAIPSSILHLPAQLPQSLAVPLDLSECPICYEDFIPSGQNTLITNCNHKFHTSCILQYWQSQPNDRQCPYCRHILLN